MSGGIAASVVEVALSVDLQRICCKHSGQPGSPARQDVVVDVTDLDLQSRLLAGLPIVNVFYDRLGIDRLLETHVPVDARLRVSPAAALGVVIRNLVVRHAPVYALGEWASRYEPSAVGLAAGEVELLNDDRVGRMLSRLFDADRASLLTRLVLDAVDSFGIDLSRLHNDSTSLKLSGAYDRAGGHERGGKPTPAVKHGFSKDHRPDLKQLVWILTVTADGAVPITFKVADGNTADVTTHIDTWDTLVELTGEVGFLYVADSKLASFDNVAHIHARGGRFLSVLPASRKEDGVFRDWVVTNRPDWVEIARRPTRDVDHPEDVVSAYEDHLPSADGHRIIWIHSSAKARRDATRRHQAIAKAIAAIDALNVRLSSPRCRIKTAVMAEAEAREAIAEVNATRWVDLHVETDTVESFRQAKRGRPGPNTAYIKISTTRLRIRFSVDEDQVAHDAASDGMWPLITNDRQMPAAELFDAYRWQPNLEKRHAQLKGTQLVAPMWLRDPARIEGLLTCHFIAMLLSSLIERTIRQAMTDTGIDELSLYPEDRGCTAPTTARILEIFTGVARHELAAPDGTVLRTFHPELTGLQRQVLDLLAIPTSLYNPAT
jgi:transposase